MTFDVDLLWRFIGLVSGVSVALALGWMLWNLRLLYYRAWCWWQYGRKSRRRGA